MEMNLLAFLLVLLVQLVLYFAGRSAFLRRLFASLGCAREVMCAWPGVILGWWWAGGSFAFTEVCGGVRGESGAVCSGSVWKKEHLNSCNGCLSGVGVCFCLGVELKLHKS